MPSFTPEEMTNADLRCERLLKTMREALAEAWPAGVSSERVMAMYGDYYTSRPEQARIDLQKLVDKGQIRRSVRYHA